MSNLKIYGENIEEVLLDLAKNDFNKFKKEFSKFHSEVEFLKDYNSVLIDKINILKSSYRDSLNEIVYLRQKLEHKKYEETLHNINYGNNHNYETKQIEAQERLENMRENFRF